MRRLLWVALGAAGGVYTARKVSVARERLTPDHAANRAATQLTVAGGAARQFVVDVRAATRRRDAELRQALGLSDGGPAVGADAQRVADLLGVPGPADRAHLAPPPPVDSVALPAGARHRRGGGPPVDESPGRPDRAADPR